MADKKVFSVEAALNREGHQINLLKRVVEKERKEKDDGLVVI